MMLDKKQFENLCKLQCSIDEMASWFDCTESDIYDWCLDTYDESFDTVYAAKSKAGLISLRRSQFKLAEKSAPMAMFLGKQYLGQNDGRVDVNVSASTEDDDGEDRFLAAVITNAARPNTD